MELQLKKTRDGSYTLYRPDLDEHYHSIYGAVQESQYIYINNGLQLISKPVIRIFDLGFGTGLNAILSLIDSDKSGKALIYDSIEKYPLNTGYIRKLNYTDFLPENYHDIFYKIHDYQWNVSEIAGSMKLTKISGDIRDYVFTGKYDLIYFDAFSPEKEPDLWSADIFRKIFHALDQGGLLVTYSVKGKIRRILADIGFTIQKIQGPPGKKQILKASKYLI